MQKPGGQWAGAEAAGGAVVRGEADKQGQVVLGLVAAFATGASNV